VKRETAKPTASGPNSGSTDPNAKVSADSGKESSTVDFQDVVLPQDACQAGDVQMFQKRSTEPVLSESAAPYVTGLSPAGRMVSAVNSHSRFYGAPLVAWTPSTGATKYDVEWSRTSNPWHAAGRKQTPATSLVLPLTPGTWYYRVRGLNPWLPKNASLRWSGPMRVQIAPPTFSVSGG
jgi:hypothetical protein